MSGLRQHTRSDCGATCLVYLARRLHHGLSLAHARVITGTTLSGATALGLVHGARALGLEAAGFQGRDLPLESLPLPCIVHLEDGPGHFVVLTRVGRRVVRIMDPAVGRQVRRRRAAFLAAWSGVGVYARPGVRFDPRSDGQSPVRRMGALLRPYAPAIAHSFLCSCLATAVAIVSSLFLRQIVDAALPHGRADTLILLSAGCALLLLLRTGYGAAQFLISSYLGQAVDGALVLGYFNHILRLPQDVVSTMRTGDILARFNDAVQIRSFLTTALGQCLLGPVTCLGSLAALLLCNQTLGLLVLAQIPLQVGLFVLITRSNRRRNQEQRERGAEMLSHVTSSLQALPTIRQHGVAGATAARCEQRLVAYLRASFRGAAAAFAFSCAGAWLAQVVNLLVFYIAARAVMAGQMSFGQMIFGCAIASFASSGIAGLLQTTTDLQQAGAALTRLFDLLDCPPEDASGTARLLPDTPRTLEVKEVSLRYAGARPLVEGLTFTCRPGSITAITGPSGSGKSTLLAALQKAHPLERGRILCDGIDLQYLASAELRTHLAVVGQQAGLVAGTILENIALGTAPDLRRATALCEELGLMPFIDDLPKKFDTLLGDGGLTLSGGQRQKLALARAFHRGCRLLLLDEPTAGLDHDSVTALLELLARRAGSGATIVLATHHRRLIERSDATVTLAAAAPLPLCPTA